MAKVRTICSIVLYVLMLFAITLCVWGALFVAENTAAGILFGVPGLIMVSAFCADLIKQSRIIKHGERHESDPAPGVYAASGGVVALLTMFFVGTVINLLAGVF